MAKLTKRQEQIIDRWISAVETGKPSGDYSKVTVMNDGPDAIKQITYGKHQTTEAGGNLQRMVKAFINSANVGDDYELLRRFCVSSPYTQSGNRKVWIALEQAGKNPVMRRIQDGFFRDKYLKPALAWAEKNGFTLALSKLVIYDSFIHSGKVFQFLRNRFPAFPPANGGDEKQWVAQYVQTRHQWLKHWGDRIKNPTPAEAEKIRNIRASRYRTRGLLELVMVNGDWNLSGESIRVNGIEVVPPKPEPDRCLRCGQVIART